MNRMAEHNIIGSLLLDINSIQKVYDDLQPEMFQDEILQRAYFEIRKSYDIGEGTSLVTLCQQLEGCGFSQNVVFKELKDCIEGTETSVTIGSYAEIVVNKYKAKRLAKIVNSVNLSPNGINDQIGAIIGDLEALLQNDKPKLKSLRAIVEENQGRYFVDLPETGVRTGFGKLDDILGTLDGGDITVIGARPAVGKSAFVTQMIGSMAKAGKKVIFYNLEMMDRQVYERMLSAQSGIGLKRIRRAKSFLGDEEQRFRQANKELSNYNVLISSGAKKISEIRNECRHQEADVIVIDYLQLLRSDKWYSNRAAEVGDISKSVKALAMELNIPIIVLSQLNRVSEMRENKEPTMAEMRESGDIEQDASNILLLWNTDADDNTRKAIKIEKQRQGENGKIGLYFNGSQMRFEEVEYQKPDGFMKPEEKTPFD